MKTTGRKFPGLVVFAAALLLLGCAGGPEPDKLLNLSHLEHLTETVWSPLGPYDIVHIYSEAPDYGWVDADSEGVACVDDAARAAVLWLRLSSSRGDSQALGRARRLLRFVLRMQQPNGLFANFLLPDRRPNLTGRTSRPSMSWWTARAAWAISEGLLVFRRSAPEFADSLTQALEKLRPHVDSLLQYYGEHMSWRGRLYPTWLISGTGADASAVLLLAWTNWYRTAAHPELALVITRLAEGIVEMQVTDTADSLFGALLCYRGVWHAWGALQAYALLRCSEVLADDHYQAVAERELRHWYGRQLVKGRFHEVKLNPRQFGRFPQIAYDVRPGVWAMLELSCRTGDSTWSVAAGLWASWLFGNNCGSVQMYDPATGRCFDGLLSADRLNRNAGAESTIEALLTLEAVSRDPVARRALRWRWAGPSKQIESRAVRVAVDPEGRQHRVGYSARLGFELLVGSRSLSERGLQ